MKHLARLASLVVNTPLMIHPGKLDAILHAVGPRLGLAIPEKAADTEWMQEEQEHTTTAAGVETIAVIGIYDSLIHHSRGLNAWSGLTSYDQIGAEFDEAMEEGNVSTILFDIDSPGGQVAGMFDLVDRIYQARSDKQIIAMVNESAYSAAYAIASAAETVYIPRTGGAGSIGVIALHVDQSKWDKETGLKYTPIFAGARKNDFSPHEPLSEEAYATFKAEIDQIYSLFTETVARNRGMTAEAVRKTEAGMFQGKNAVEIGFADEIASWDQAVNKITTRKNGGFYAMPETPDYKTQLEAILTAPDFEAATALAELGYIPTPTGDQTPEALTAAGVKQGLADERTRATAVAGLCTLAETPELTEELVKSGVSAEDARKKILAAKAAAGSEGETITSTTSGLKSGGINPLIADAEKRAGISK